MPNLFIIIKAIIKQAKKAPLTQKNLGHFEASLWERFFRPPSKAPQETHEEISIPISFSQTKHFMLLPFNQFNYGGYLNPSAIASLAALRPQAPSTPPPGCVPAPQRYSPSTGVLYLAHPPTGR